MYFEELRFGFRVDIALGHEAIVYEWVQQICELRLHRYFARKAMKLEGLQ